MRLVESTENLTARSSSYVTDDASPQSDSHSKTLAKLIKRGYFLFKGVDPNCDIFANYTHQLHCAFVQPMCFLVRAMRDDKLDLACVACPAHF